jgi:VanZ family protein
MVSDMASFNPYSLLHIPLYGILTLLLILSLPPSKGKFGNTINSSNPSNSRNYFFAGIIALVVAIADEIHQAYLPNRNASFTDVLLDVVGIIFFVLVLRRIQNIPWFSKRIKSLRRITQ